MDLGISGRTALVTGADSGIGRETARMLLAEGVRVVITDVDAEALEKAAAELGDGVTAIAADLTDAADVDRLKTEVVAAIGDPQILVNAAGINPRATLLEGPDEAFQDLWSVNAMGPILAVRAAWPHLKASGQGRVINVASLSGKRVRNDNLGYAMSKFAVMALTQEVRRLGWEHGIRATALCPGFVDTDMTSHVTSLPRDRMTRPEDLALLAEMLLRLPNTASVAELLVNCRHEDTL